MPPRASDLPHSVRRQVLQQLESQLGYFEYQRLVGAMGEEGVLDMVLGQTFASQPALSSARSTWSGPRRFRMLSAGDFASVTREAALWTFMLPTAYLGLLGYVWENGWVRVIMCLAALAGWIWICCTAKWLTFAVVPGVWIIAWVICAIVKFCEKR